MEHLVEAATALTRLNPSNSQELQKAGPSDAAVEVVSDDDNSKRAASSSVTASASSPVVSPPRNTTVNSNATTTNVNNSKKEIFPQKLMSVLSDSSLSDIISWLPHGRSFVIIRPDVFTEQIMPKHFPPMDSRASSKYPSFTRKLNRWGFRQATRGADTGAFHHALFQRDQPELCLDMVCQRSRDRKGSASAAGRASKGPLKKRASMSSAAAAVGGNKKLAPTTARVPATLTKEALDSLQTIAVMDRSALHSVVSVTEESSAASDNASCRSERSSSPGGAKRVQRRVTADDSIVKTALQQRDDMERLRVARAMLYNAYMNVLKNPTPQP